MRESFYSVSEWIDVKCEKCGVDVDLPFKCSYCGRFFCVEHRLPEGHECSEYWRVKIPRTTGATEPAPPRSYGFEYKYPTIFQPVAKPKIFWFSSIEVKHLVVGIVLVSLVGISFITRSILFSQPLMLLIESTVFILSFIAHELSHKFAAQKFGLWAEFRLSISGALITLISVLLPFKVIAPGSVVIGGMADRETVGRTAVSGPLVNVILSAAFLVGAVISPIGVLYDSLLFGAWFNAYLAIFNLLPFGALDGWKVFWWSRRNWALVFSVSVLIGVYSFIRLG